MSLYATYTLSRRNSVTYQSLLFCHVGSQDHDNKMGCGPSKMKVRPVYKPLSDGAAVTRIFTPWGDRVRSPDQPMQVELHQTQDIGMTMALFVIRYKSDASGEYKKQIESQI